MRITSAFVLIIVMFASGCSPKSGTSTSKTGGASGKYSEDLSVWRPKGTDTDTTKRTTQAPTNTNQPQKSQYVDAKYAINNTLDAVLDSISRINLSVGYIDGYTIQVYSGLKRDEALNARRLLSQSLPEVASEVQYVQPNYRVRVGKYFDRFSAQKDYSAVKRYFANAILIPERIAIQ
jgi:hypothetical protein